MKKLGTPWSQCLVIPSLIRLLEPAKLNFWWFKKTSKKTKKIYQTAGVHFARHNTSQDPFGDDENDYPITVRPLHSQLTNKCASPDF